MTTDERHLYFHWATQYYISGRFALLARLSPVCGNLFHHAIEMYLKGYFSKQYDARQFNKFKKSWGHNLPKIWQAFKSAVTDPALNQFDDTISKLHKFEDIRYPDEVISQGACLVIGIKKSDVSYTPSSAPKAQVMPDFRISLEEVDTLVKIIFEKSSVNPPFFKGFFHTDDASTYLNRENETGIAM